MTHKQIFTSFVATMLFLASIALPAEARYQPIIPVVGYQIDRHALIPFSVASEVQTAKYRKRAKWTRHRVHKEHKIVKVHYGNKKKVTKTVVVKKIVPAIPLPRSKPATLVALHATQKPPDVVADLQEVVTTPFKFLDKVPEAQLLKTAVYNIAAKAVFMPNGEKLEAHSGVGGLKDNPKFAYFKNRGPTPPNVYNLSLREKKFHGVAALRLNPENEKAMKGRDGILAHTYLRREAMSQGCIVFKDYYTFLKAFLKGEVDKIVVVAGVPVEYAKAVYQPRRRYAMRHRVRTVQYAVMTKHEQF